MIPRQVHFVYGLRPQDEPFHLVHHLAIASALAVVQPDEVHVHCGELPYGVYWDLVRPHVTLHRIEPVAHVSDFAYDDAFVEQFSYAHHADFVRLDVLARHGGVYADIDTLFVAPVPDAFWREECVLGREPDVVDQRIGVARPSVSNALIMAAPGASFVEQWRMRTPAAFDGSWSGHSCFLAHDLAVEHPDDVRVEPERTFHGFGPTPAGLRRLLVERATDDELAGVASVHLAAHLWWDEARTDFVPEVYARTIDEDWVRRGDSTYAALAQRFLPEHGLF